MNHVQVYGGFEGTEAPSFELGNRDLEAHLTILSGDIHENDTTTDGEITDTDDISGTNSRHVVTSSGTDSTALLTGVTITAGYATRDYGGYEERSGAGIVNTAGSRARSQVTIM